jgi:hypothetical protein
MQSVQIDTPVMTSDMSTPDTHRCANCGATCNDRYCAACGQRRFTGRHTLRSLAGGVLSRVFNTEEGIGHTIAQLTVRPGTMIREYLSGRTACYTHPAAYLLIAAAVFTLGLQLVAASTGAGDENRIFALMIIPFVAAASRALFWRGRYNYAEHLIAVMYLCASAARARRAVSADTVHERSGAVGILRTRSGRRRRLFSVGVWFVVPGSPRRRDGRGRRGSDARYGGVVHCHALARTPLRALITK